MLVDLTPELNNAAPSVRLHYRAFIPTVSCSVPVPRISTLALMGASHLSFSLGHRGDRFPRSVHEPDPESRRLYAGCRPGSNQASPRLVPGQRLLPGFDIVDTLSTRHRRFAFARLSEPHLTGSCPAFSATLTTTTASHLLASVRSWHTIICKPCILDVGVLAEARGLFRPLQHIAEQWRDDPPCGTPLGDRASSPGRLALIPVRRLPIHLSFN